MPAVNLGDNITLFCDLNNELEDNAFWSRSYFNGSNLVHFINSLNVPLRYRTRVISPSNMYSVMSLTIYGLTMDDIGTFMCTGSSVSKINLTLARMNLNE